MEKVFVCAGMGLAKSEEINRQAAELGEMLAENDCIYFQGGSTNGLMGVTLKAFLQKSNNVRFVVPSAYYKKDVPELIKLVGSNFWAERAETEFDRLKRMKECDRIIVLPGGTGTLEELLYLNETSRADEHCAKIELVNIDGFYNGLLDQLYKQIEEGLLNPSSIKFNVYENVKELDFGKCKQ